MPDADKPAAKTTYKLDPPETIHDAFLHAIHAEHDQPRSDEVTLGGGISMVLGIRNVFFRAGTNHVFAVPGAWHELEVKSEDATRH